MAHTPEPSDEPPLSSPTSESLPSQPNTPPDAKKQNPDKNDYAAIRARRRAQNRLSQRAFRERRERHVKNLEHQFQDLLIKHQMLLKSYWMQKTELVQLRRTVDQLTVELQLRDASNAATSSNNNTTTSPRNAVANGNNANSRCNRPVNSACTRPCMDTTAATPSSLSPSTSSTSSSSSSSLGFDEMNPAFSNNTTSNNNDMNMPFFPVDTQLQPQIQPQGQPQPSQPRFNADQVNILSADDSYGYGNSLADWSCGIDMDSLGLNLGLNNNNKGFDLMGMTMTATGMGSVPSKNPNDVCFGWSYL
ncbi:hypothetical protein VTN96DRAFT_5806 [Rasamsonia emersonii]